LKKENSFVELISRQKGLEEGMVKAVEALERVHNADARLLLGELRLESTKHANICQ